MDMRKLNHAVVLAQTLSFTKAAEKLNLTQSALSQSIKALEEEYQVQLFDRTRGHVKLTSVGRKFVDHAQQLLRDGTSFETMLRQAARGESGDIAIGLAPLPTKLFLAPLLSDMMSAPNLHIEAVISNPGELFAALIQEKIELCVSSNHRVPADAPITGIALSRDTYSFAPIVRAGHPLTRQGPVSVEQLQAFPTLLPGKFDVDTSYRPKTRPVMTARPAVVVENYDVLLNVTRSSDAIWIAPPQAVKEELRTGELTVLTTKPALAIPPAELMVFHLRNRYLSPTAKRVIERLKVIAENR